MNGRPFKPGNTFGKGRPKGSSYVQTCQQWAEQGGWAMLIQWAAGRESSKKVPWVIRKYAANTLLAYGYGRPRQEVDITAHNDPLKIDLSRITTEQLQKLANLTIEE